jgi:hypothetical protein
MEVIREKALVKLKEEKRFKPMSWRMPKKEREWENSLLQADDFDQKYHRKAIKSGRKHG